MSETVVSVIIPARDEEATIEACVASVWGQDLPPQTSLEVIVVDNNSKDRTAELAVKAGAKVLSQLSGAIGAVRNRGIRCASGEVIGFMDADCVANKAWVKSALACFRKDQDLGCVGGACLSPSDGNIYQRGWAPSQTGNFFFEIESLATGSFFIRRQVLEHIGQFDENVVSGEDMEICRRIRLGGYRLVKTSGCNVTHHGFPDNAWSFLKRQIWHGSANFQREDGFKDKVFWISLVFLLNTLSICFSVVSSRWLPLIGSLVSLTCLVVGLAAYRRFLKKIYSSEISFIAVVWLNFLYLTGRSIGILRGGYNNALKGRGRLKPVG